MKGRAWFLVLTVAVPLSAYAQNGIPEFFMEQVAPVGEGWAGFLDFRFLINALLTLILAAALGGAFAHHPKLLETADTLEEIDASKVYILYSVIGALIGMLVVKYGLVVGFVLFGIGGLIRFRTVLGSAVLTGHVIFITLIGLACGLDLPHVAVLATVFGFVLVYVLDAQTTYEADIRGLPQDRFVEAAASYREALRSLGCKVIRERKNPEKLRLNFIVVGGKFSSSSKLEKALDGMVDPSLRGSIDWEIN